MTTIYGLVANGAIYSTQRPDLLVEIRTTLQANQWMDRNGDGVLSDGSLSAYPSDFLNSAAWSMYQQKMRNIDSLYFSAKPIRPSLASTARPALPCSETCSKYDSLQTLTPTLSQWAKTHPTFFFGERHTAAHVLNAIGIPSSNKFFVTLLPILKPRVLISEFLPADVPEKEWRWLAHFLKQQKFPPETIELAIEKLTSETFRTNCPTLYRHFPAPLYQSPFFNGFFLELCRQLRTIDPSATTVMGCGLSWTDKNTLKTHDGSQGIESYAQSLQTKVANGTATEQDRQKLIEVNATIGGQMLPRIAETIAKHAAQALKTARAQYPKELIVLYNGSLHNDLSLPSEFKQIGFTDASLIFTHLNKGKVQVGPYLAIDLHLALTEDLTDKMNARTGNPAIHTKTYSTEHSMVDYTDIRLIRYTKTRYTIVLPAVFQGSMDSDLQIVRLVPYRKAP